MMRRAKLADLGPILAIENACFASDRMDADAYRRYLASHTSEVWLATVEGEVAATLVLAHRLHARNLRVYSIAVHPRHRGVGLARQLMQLAIRRARRLGLAALTLEVRPDNTAAIQLYTSLGLRRMRELADYYEDGSSALRLALVFNHRAGPGTGRATSARR